MNKKVLAWGATAVTAAALSLLLVGTALAEEPVDSGSAGGGRTPWGHFERGAGFVWDSVTDLLGMAQDEITAALDEGASLADLAADKGVTDEELATAVTTAAQQSMALNTEERFAELTWASLDEQVGRRTARQSDRRPGTRGVASEAVTALLGMTDEEVYAARAEGLTLAAIAEDNGVSEEDLLQAVTAEFTAAIESALADGDLTEEQAEWLIARQAALAGYQITDPFAPGEGWPQGRGARGMETRPFGR